VKKKKELLFKLKFKTIQLQNSNDLSFSMECLVGNALSQVKHDFCHATNRFLDRYKPINKGVFE